MTVTAATRTRPGTSPAAPAKAVLLAAAHLRALGCTIEHQPLSAAGEFTVRAGRARARCALSWAGPVDLPLTSEADVQAACGVMHVHGRRYGGPTPLGVDYATCLAGALAATGTLAALASQAAGSVGEPEGVRVSTSVAHAALLAVGQYLAAATATDGPEDDAAEWPEGVVPAGPPFVSADGVRFELETLNPEAWRGFWAALGVDGKDAGRGWLPFQQRYATAVCPLPPSLSETTAHVALPHLQRVARETGVDVTVVATEPPPAANSDAPPWQLRPTGRSGPAGASRPAGVTGTGGIVGPRRPNGPTVPDRSPRIGAPLDGVTVVEVCRRVQGPLAGHLLGLLGAHVVRVEPPGGDPMRGMPPMAGDCSARFTALNHGKDTLEADLTTASGRAAVRELVAEADVLLHTLAPGKDRRFGLDAETLAAVRPRLVHAGASGWGDERGEHPPVGTDFPVQAWSGLAALVTPAGLPPAPSLLTLTDVLGGVVCAEGAVAGLLAARSTGRGQAVTSSLLSAARLLSRPLFRSNAAAPTVPTCTDLGRLAADPRLAPALDRGPCALVRSPWEFHR